MVKSFYTMALVCLMMFIGVGSAFADVTMTANPQAGSTVKELSEVVLTFNGTADKGSKAGDVTVISNKGYSASVTVELGTNENQINLYFSKLTEEADYTIVVPAGAITVDGTDVEVFALNYTIGEEKSATVTPAPGDVQWLTTVIYNYPVEASLSTVYGADPATVTCPDGTTIQMIPEYNWQLGNGKYTLRLAKAVTEAGEYTVTIPEGLMKYTDPSDWSSVMLPGGSFKYNVTGGTLTNFTSVPSTAKGINMFDAFDITFPDYTVIAKNPTYKPSVYLMKEGSNSYSSISMDYNMTVADNVLSYSNQYTKVIEPGHYYISFPEGCLLLGEDETPCTPFTLEFDIVEPEAVNIVLTPADGATVNMLNHAIINFPDNDDVTMNSGAQVTFQRQLEDGTWRDLGGAYGSYSIETIDAKTYRANFSGMAIQDGTYKITLAKNSFTVGDGFNQEVSSVVTFVCPELVVPVITPADGSALDKIQQFTITFPTEAVVKVNEKYSSKTSTLYKGSSIEINEYGTIANTQAGSASSYAAVEGKTNEFTFSLSQAVIEKGDYVLSIPAGVFLIGEDEHSFSAAAEFHFSATGNGVDKIEVTPAAPAQSVSEVTVTYVNETSIKAQSEWISFSIMKVNTEQSWDDYQGYVPSSNIKIEDNKCTLTLDKEYTEDGTYYFDITAWSFYMSDGVTASTPQRVYFTVDSSVTTAISDVNEECRMNNGETFNIVGQRVANNAKGLVIKNGKKLFVK